MNERTKQLLVQATAFARENVEYSRTEGFDIFTEKLYEVSRDKFAELIVRECAEFVSNDRQNDDYGVFVSNRIKQHFGIEEHKGWVCPKCGADRTKIVCPLGFGATVDGRCPMTVEAQ
jgi:hypothetical protein